MSRDMTFFAERFAAKEVASAYDNCDLGTEFLYLNYSFSHGFEMFAVDSEPAGLAKTFAAYFKQYPFVF